MPKLRSTGRRGAVRPPAKRAKGSTSGAPLPSTAPTPVVLDQASMEAIVAAVSKEVVGKLAAQPPPPPSHPEVISTQAQGEAAIGLPSAGLPAESSGNVGIGSVIGVMGSMPLTLDVLVDPELAQEITEGKFVEFGRLVPDLRRFGPSNPRFKPNNKYVPPVEKFSDWLGAFFRFASVYLKAFPSQVIPLLKYGDTIRFFYERGYDWKYYDELFRKAKAGCDFPWYQFQQELFAMTFNHRSPLPSYNRAPQVSPRFGRAPVCRSFNSSTGCSFKRCKFRHVCSDCEGPHSSESCGKKLPYKSASNPNKRR